LSRKFKNAEVKFGCYVLTDGRSSLLWLFVDMEFVGVLLVTKAS